MRKCKIVFNSSKVYFSLMIDEEKMKCSFCNKITNVDITKLLDKIENIIAHWQQPQTTSNIIDGARLDIYFVDNSNTLKEMKFNDINLPSNTQELISLMEALNG